MSFVDVYDTRTGIKHTVPDEWLDHPILGRNLRRTPLAAEANPQTSSPFDAWTVDQLKEYADQHDVDVSGATRKAELVTAITASMEPPSGGEKEGDSVA